MKLLSEIAFQDYKEKQKFTLAKYLKKIDKLNYENSVPFLLMLPWALKLGVENNY